MAGEIYAILKVLEPVKDFVFGSVSEYVGYIGSFEENLDSLHTTLKDLCNKKDDIEKKVREGNDKQETITRVAASWLQDVRVLPNDEVLKRLIYMDTETAKFVLKMMGKKDLKRCLIQEKEMQKVAIKVMMKLKEELEKPKGKTRTKEELEKPKGETRTKEELEKSEGETRTKEELEKSEGEMRSIMEEDYKKVAEVVVEVLKDTIEEFKKLLKEDKKMAVIAARTFKGRDLDILIEGDVELEEILREAGNESDEVLRLNNQIEESSAPLIPPVDSNKNRVKEAAKNLFTPLANLLIPLGRLMDDPSFKKAVPEAGSIKLALDVFDALVIKNRGMMEMDGNAKRCCCCSLSFCDYHDRYRISKDAEFMVKHIKDDIIGKCPQDPVTIRIRIQDLNPVPSNFLKGLESRTKLMDQILTKLNDDHVLVVGVYGMGGTGKTTLAKEVNNRVKDIFNLKAMVEVSDSPDIARIQSTIADSIGLPLHDVVDIRQRAVKLYNKLSEKENKVLIILDNVWKMLDLYEIGIPSTCKILLTTREREVCRVMGVQEANIYEVGLMNTKEARELFKSQVGNQVDIEKYKNMVDRLLNKCGGLPLAIVATGNSLKDKDLHSWEKFADDLEKPISSQISSQHRRTYAILSTSYKFIEVKEKRIFFLLACLTPVGSSTSIETLMRYGIGLNLFKHVNKLSEAVEQADTWANELVLSSMLLEGDVKGQVKIHDIVREFAISLAAEAEGHKFMVEDIPRWMDDETLRKYTAMSLTSMEKCSCFAGVEASKLQILILKGDISSNFNHSFFEGMTNLEVLVLSNMTFEPSLPESMGKLKKLRTLCMEGCKLGDIKQVGVLVNLLVLSLRYSSFKELPDEIGELSKLRLLDLSECTCIKMPLIQTTVLSRLSKLEGLYTFINQEGVSVFEKKTDEEMGIDENRWPYLNVFEARVPGIEDLAIVWQCLQNFDKFRVSVGEMVHYEFFDSFSRVLNIYEIDGLSRCIEKSCLKALLKKVDRLVIKSNSDNIESIVPEWDEDGFQDLEFLEISGCDNITRIVNGCMTHNSTTFPRLRSLDLSDLKKLKRIYDGEAPEKMFCNLQNLSLEWLPELEYGLPRVPCNLKDIYVYECRLLNFIFREDEGVKVIELPFLKSLELYRLPCLLSLVGPKDPSTIIHAFEYYFFNGNITYPSLEVFILSGCDNIVKLWNKEIPSSSFGNLKEVAIARCPNLLNVGPPCAFSSFVHLESLDIEECDKMSEIITPEDTGELKVIRFPELKFLSIDSLDVLESFYKGKSKLEFPKLEKLKLGNIRNMKSFAKSENSLALFHENITYPSLEVFILSRCDNIVKLWNKEIPSSSFGNLKVVQIEECHNLLNIGPAFAFSSFVQLESLYIHRCDKMSEIITPEDMGESKVIRFPKLKLLSIQSLRCLESFYKGKSKLEFPKLEELRLCNILNMKSFAKSENSLALFHENIDFPCLHTLEVTNMPAVNALWDSQADRVSVMSNPAPMLRHLELGLRLIPSVILKNLSFLHLNSYQTGEVIFSSSDVETKEGFVWRCSHLPRLEGLHVKNNESLKELFKAEDYDGVGGTFCGQLKTLVLNSLPTLKLIPLNLFKGLESLTLFGLEWEYVVSAAVLGDSLQQLQFLEINSCHYIEAIVIDVGTSLELPRLKKLSLFRLASMKSFSSTTNGEATLRLPSLESLVIGVCDALEHFWSGSIVAPRLQSVILFGCDKMQHLLVGNTERVLEFPSLQQVDIKSCSDMKSISVGPLNAPKLRQVNLDFCRSMECFLPENPNHSGVLQLSSLEAVYIRRCPKLHSFSFTPPVAPKLTHVSYNYEDYSMLAYNNLNHFLKEMLAERREGEKVKEEEERKRRMGQEETNEEENEKKAAVEDI